MTKPQKATAVIAVLAALLLTLFPPWKEISRSGMAITPSDARLGHSSVRTTHSAGHHFIFNPPQMTSANVRQLSTYKIDLVRWGIYWAVLLVAAGGGLVAARARTKEGEA